MNQLNITQAGKCFRKRSCCSGVVSYRLRPRELCQIDKKFFAVLCESHEVDVIRAYLDEPTASPFQPYRQRSEDRMIAVAADRVKQWGRRYPDDDDDRP